MTNWIPSLNPKTRASSQCRAERDLPLTSLVGTRIQLSPKKIYRECCNNRCMRFP
jgi:hypothetical protein